MNRMAANNVGLPAGVSKEQVGLFISYFSPLMGFLSTEVDTLFFVIDAWFLNTSICFVVLFIYFD